MRKKATTRAMKSAGAKEGKAPKAAAGVKRGGIIPPPKDPGCEKCGTKVVVDTLQTCQHCGYERLPRF